MRKTLDTIARRCVCGAHAQYSTGPKGERFVGNHLKPDGSPCVEYEHQQAVIRTQIMCAAAGVPGPEHYQPEEPRNAEGIRL